MKIIDMHCDTIPRAFYDKKNFADGDLNINIEKLKKGGALAQCFALFIITGAELEEEGLTGKSPEEVYEMLLAEYNKQMDLNSDSIKRALSKKDILQNEKDGYISSILTIEDGVSVNGDLSNIDRMYSDGVRLITLTWNHENCFGYPNSTDPELHMKGLKPFGKEAVEYMQEKGILVDVSHLSEGGFWDVAKMAKKPFVASHSCCRAYQEHSRNLSDKQLSAIGDTGSVVGLNFCPIFLGGDGEHSHADDVVGQMLHLYNKCGIESIAWGSDFDGIFGDRDFGDYDGMPYLVDKLSKYFTDDQLDKINHDNFLRIFE